MGDQKGVLIFSKNNRERKSLAGLLHIGEGLIFDTADGLEALQLLQKESIGVILAGSDIGGMGRREFKGLVEKLSPGTNILFTSSFAETDQELSLSIEECGKLVRDYLRVEGSLRGEVSEVKNFSFSLADRLLQIFAAHDKYFFNNDHLVAELSWKIALRMGLEDDLAEAIRMAALLRDLGKVAIHQEILQENRRLSDGELMPIKAHPSYTMQILRQVRFPWNVDSIISQHHEHYDGSGYPLGLKGREISIGARIISAADAYYAMTTDRPYRRARSKENAVAEIRRNAGSQFDPEIVEVFLTVTEEESAAKPESCVLIFEREPNVSPLIRLNAPAETSGIFPVASSIEAFSHIRQKNPCLVIVDIESVSPEIFMRFYNTAKQTADAANRRFILILPEEKYMRYFNGGLGGNVEYLVKPVNIDRLLQKIRSLSGERREPVSKGGSKGLSGRIEDFNLSDIIQVLSLGLKTAKVEVAGESGSGTLYLRHGKLVHASAGSLSGRDAFFELMKWERGNFFIIHGETATDVNITSDLMRLLIEAAESVEEKAPDLRPDGQGIPETAA